jgi:hypothetical protein
MAVRATSLNAMFWALSLGVVAMATQWAMRCG